MKRVVVFLIFISLYSCNYFNVKKTDSETILNEELKTFNWNEVDTYPTFLSCDSTTIKQERKLCFENTLASFIANNLQQDTIVVTQNIEDTIFMKFQISEQGKLSLLEIKVDTLTVQEIPEIKIVLMQSLDSLPEIFPAIKRGQHVKTEFTLPIVVKIN